MDDPLISIILPTRLRPELLARAVGSVFAQTETGFELIVVDDNLPEARATTVSALAPWRDDPRLRLVIHDQPRNAAAARNAGLAVARGKWVTYLDDDDAYAPGKLAAQRRLAELSGAPLVLCGLRYHLGRRRRDRQCELESFAGRDILLAAQGAAPALFHRCDPAAVFDETFDAAEDQELFLRLVERWSLGKVFNVPLPLVDVFPQPTGVRVNVPSPALWAAQQRICVRFAPRFGRQARRLAVARAGLLRQRAQRGGLASLGRASIRLLAVGGAGEGRLILNTWMLRVPGLRQWVVT